MILLLEIQSAYFVVYWPSTRPNRPFQKRGSSIFHWRGRAWLTIWDRVKIPRYSHRLMLRKRVTCDLHDSYFRSMMIKHTIPKIEWAIELLYNSVHRKFNEFGDQKRWRNDAVEKTAPSRELGPRASGWATQENGKETLMANRVGRSICCSSVRSPTPSHTQNFQINWDVYFSKNCVARLYCVVVRISRAYVVV